MLKEFFFNKGSNISYSEETIDILKLIRSENVGPITFLKLIKTFGNARSALENIEQLSINGGHQRPIKIYSQESVELELELLSKNNSKLLTYLAPEYSKLLLEIPDFPPVISYKGNIELLNSTTLAIVGSRNASINTQAFTSKIATELVNQGYVIVSGLARGIDTAAHKVSIDKTVAVVAGGIDYIYPSENAKLYQEIADNGLIIAELAINTKPLGKHFPQRNRLISGLSLGTLVVEASLRSGSLITARTALDQNREVFAVPGFPLDPRSEGTNKLIKDGAILVQSIEDITNNLNNFDRLINSDDTLADSNYDFNSSKGNYLNQINNQMRQQIVDYLSSAPTSLEDIIEKTDLPIQVIHMIILELELAGRIIRSPGNKISLLYK
ncbi:MAG: DNA-protecting protein DprA [Rickettsiaceae bacterium]|nr:MAG: DNA-protecting protein DprA [Rickettsiaceae bacterium]